MAAGVYSGVTALTQNNVIGGPAAGNIISGNGVTGIEIVNEGISPTGNSILSNRIGVDITGTTGVPNGTGIVTSGATNTSIGSPAAGAGNQLSGNNGSPISIRGTGTTVQGNLIGTNAAGNSAIPNGGGIYIGGPSSNTLIGGSVPGARNIISGNLGDAIGIWGEAGVTAVTVQGNYVGVGSDGATSLGNSSPDPDYGAGVNVRNYASNIVVGGLAGEGNLIANNSWGGVVAYSGTGLQVLGNTIQNNRVGVFDFSPGYVVGNTILSNHQYGVQIGNGVTLGGTTAARRNVISGNQGVGVFLNGVSGDTVQGNYIGTNSSGTASSGNNGAGIFLQNSNFNLIGGTASGAGNVISGTIGGEGGGFEVEITGSSNVVQGNLIGTDASGMVALGSVTGVLLNNASGNTIGGAIPGARNIISGNGQDGIEILAGSTGNNVFGNYIGCNVSGVLPLGNGGHGIKLTGSNNNPIGGLLPGQGNVIAFNKGAGVCLESYESIEIPPPLGNAILSNSIFGNLKLGIDRGADGVLNGDGVTPNRVPSHNPGPQPYPTSAGYALRRSELSSSVCRSPRIDDHTGFDRKLARYTADNPGVL
jgi:hypothetical protein